MTVLFLGGPLDGELREVDCQTGARTTEILLFIAPDGEPSTTTASRMYHIANGIARHESVSEEEVAKRLHARLQAEPMTAADIWVLREAMQVAQNSSQIELSAYIRAKAAKNDMSPERAEQLIDFMDLPSEPGEV